MPSVRETIYDTMSRYPTIRSDIGSCFYHLFLHSGGGYEWIDGELVYTAGDFFEPCKPFSDFNDTPETAEDIRVNMRLYMIQEHFDLFFNEHVSFRYVTFDMSDYGPVFSIPKGMELKEDWANALDRTIDAACVYLRTLSHMSGYKIDKTRRDLWIERLEAVQEQVFPGRRERMKKQIDRLKKDGFFKDIIKELSV